MTTTEKPRAGEWKDRYFKALNEFDEQERTWSEQLTRINRDLLLVLDRFRGCDPAFDHELEAVHASGSRHDEIRQSRIGSLVQQARALHIATAGAASSPGSAPQAAASPAAATTVLLELLSALRAPLQHADALSALRRELGVEGDDGALDQLTAISRVADQFSALLHAGTHDGIAPARDAIQTLLDHLSLPAAQQATLGLLIPALQRADDEAGLRHVAKDIANFLVEYVASLHAEVAGLNRFLLVIKGRLDQVSEHVVRDGDDRARASAAREQLDLSVRGHLENMRGQVNEAEDVEQLKTAIQDQIARLDGSVTNFLSSESAHSDGRAASHRELAAQVAAMKKESDALRRRLGEAQDRARHDALTGLPNRAAYNEQLDAERARMLRDGKPLSMVVVDLDKFKLINDTWGHQAGDRVLKHVARELKKQIREQDFFSRFGGEEFVLLLPDTALDGATRLAENLRRHIDACRFTYKNSEVAVTISCGIAEFSRDEAPTAVFERADAGLYVAKNNGRNRCEAIAA